MNRGTAAAGDAMAPTTRRKSRLLWIGVGLFVSAWMFGLGVLVGRGTAPVHFDMEKLQNEIAALKEAVIQEERHRYRITPEGETENQLGFFEALRSTRDKAVMPAGIPDVGEPLPPITEQQRPAPPPRPAAVEPGRLTVQVASLKDPKVADSMVGKLASRGYPAYRAIGEVPGRGIWYRVRIGTYNSRSDAEKMLRRLRSEKIKGIIVEK